MKFCASSGNDTEGLGFRALGFTVIFSSVTATITATLEVSGWTQTS